MTFVRSQGIKAHAEPSQKRGWTQEAIAHSERIGSGHHQVGPAGGAGGKAGNKPCLSLHCPPPPPLIASMNACHDTKKAGRKAWLSNIVVPPELPVRRTEWGARPPLSYLHKYSHVCMRRIESEQARFHSLL
jgi:hypothetical protein